MGLANPLSVPEVTLPTVHSSWTLLTHLYGNRQEIRYRDIWIWDGCLIYENEGWNWGEGEASGSSFHGGRRLICMGNW